MASRFFLGGGASSVRAATTVRASSAPVAAVSRRFAHTSAKTGRPEFVGDTRTTSEVAKAKEETPSKMPTLSAMFQRFMHGTRPDTSTADVVPKDFGGRHGGVVTRFDTRSPDEIRAAKGFMPWGTSLDFAKHQQGGPHLRKSAFVSTSRTFAGAKEVRDKGYGGKHGFFYEIEGAKEDSFSMRDVVDVDRFPKQDEVAIAGAVDVPRIKSVTDTRTGVKTPMKEFKPLGKREE